MPLRLVVHDYAGHPFQVQLSRELARRGHGVLHLHCPSYRSGKGAVERVPGDPRELRIDAVSLDATFEKYSPARRISQELVYARRLAAKVRAERPDVVVSSNTPLFAQSMLLRECKRLGSSFVFWQQDVYSVAMKREAERRLPAVLGELVGRRFVELERLLLRRSDAVIPISEDFRTTLLQWGLPADKLHVIENWAPLDELPQRPRNNAWSRRHGLVDKRVLLYSGTLGRKHDPSLLLRLALEARARQASNLLSFAFQDYQDLPDVLATGDVLLVLLEREAGRFAVPSKVLSYLCAARPLLASIPQENLAAKVVVASGGGAVVDPDDARGFVEAARRLLDDPDARSRFGAAARDYAEETFDIHAIGDRFEHVLESVVRAPRYAASRGMQG